VKQSDRRVWLIIETLVIAAVVITFVFFPLRIRAQDSPHARYHADFYSRWYRADGNSCCSNQDCRPASARVRDQRVEVLIDGAWVAVPPEAIRPYVAPDMEDHVCAIGTHVLCFVWGAGA
jgi:hypothetical protein